MLWKLRSNDILYIVIRVIKHNINLTPKSSGRGTILLRLLFTLLILILKPLIQLQLTLDIPHTPQTQPRFDDYLYQPQFEICCKLQVQYRMNTVSIFVLHYIQYTEQRIENTCSHESTPTDAVTTFFGPLQFFR